MSKAKSSLKAENGTVFKAVVKETLKMKRQEEMEAALAASAATAREEAKPKAGLLGRLFV